MNDDNRNFEMTLYAAVNSLPLWLCCIDTEGRYFFANDYYAKTFNVPMDKIIGHNFKEFFPPAMYEKHKRLVDECICGGKTVTFEEADDFGDGRPTCLYGIYTPLAGPDGIIYGLSAAVFNTTAKKELEAQMKKAGEELRKSEIKLKEWMDRYECVVSASGQIAYDYDVTSGEILWGSTIEKVLGYAHEEIDKGFAQWIDLLHEEDREKTLLKLSESEKNFTLFDAEYRLRHKDGHYVWVRDRGFFTSDGAGKALRQLGMIEDISERKKANDAIVRARRQAEAASRAKSLFLANISHEIRTPMNGIAGFTNLLKKSGLNGTQKEYADIIKSSCDHLLRLIDDLLDFSKIEAKKLKLESAVFNVKTAVDDSVDFISEQLKAKNLDIEVKVDERINYKVSGDQLRFTQILINLLTNAVKFTSEGKIGVSVSQLSLIENTATLSIEVRDTGIGIPPGKIDEIFEMFHQLDESAAKRHGGSGIGLSIVKGLAELMGGTVSVESEPGKGSAFKVTLPFVTAAKTVSENIR